MASEQQIEAAADKLWEIGASYGWWADKQANWRMLNAEHRAEFLRVTAEVVDALEGSHGVGSGEVTDVVQNKPEE